MKKRFTEAQIVGFLREADAGIPVKELCRKHGFSDGSYYLWRSKFGGMSVSDAKRLKELEMNVSSINVSRLGVGRIRSGLLFAPGLLVKNALQPVLRSFSKVLRRLWDRVRTRERLRC
jgi:hypothetical protein